MKKNWEKNGTHEGPKVLKKIGTHEGPKIFEKNDEHMKAHKKNKLAMSQK